MTGGDPYWIRPRLISQLLVKISSSLRALLVNMIDSNYQDCTARIVLALIVIVIDINYHVLLILLSSLTENIVTDNDKDSVVILISRNQSRYNLHKYNADMSVSTLSLPAARALCRTKLLPVTHVLVDTWMLTVKAVYKL